MLSILLAALIIDHHDTTTAPAPLFGPLAGIAFVIAFTVRPVSLPLPWREWEVAMDMTTAPIMALAVLLAGGMAPALLWEAPFGTPALRPVEVMLIFYGMAYICLSLDSTGLLQVVGQQAAHRTRSLRHAFGLVAALSGILTLFASNDIVILTLTPIIIGFCREKGYDPMPLLYLEYVSANVWSVCLLTGNPTNVIAATAAGFTFGRYLIIHATVGVLVGVLSTAVIYLNFYDKLRPKQIPTINAACTLSQAVAQSTSGSPAANRVLHRLRAGISVARLILLLLFASLDDLTGVPLWVSVAVALALCLLMDAVMDLCNVEGVSGAAWATLHRLPWEVLLFVMSLFIMVEALDVAGFVGHLAKAATRIASGGFVAAAFITGGVATLACQVLNNQPMTVLFAKILTHPEFVASPSERVAAFSALIIGSNLGANLTVIGALAGPMWTKVCQANGVHISSREFFMVMLRVTPLVAMAAFGLLSLEIYCLGTERAGKLLGEEW